VLNKVPYIRKSKQKSPCKNFPKDQLSCDVPIEGALLLLALPLELFQQAGLQPSQLTTRST
jgi:hypothetical protein